MNLDKHLPNTRLAHYVRVVTLMWEINTVSSCHIEADMYGEEKVCTDVDLNLT